MKLPRFRTALVMSLVAFQCHSFGADSLKTIPLWPGKPPGDTAQFPEEKDLTKDSDGKISGKRLIRLGNVASPTLTLYPAPKEKNTGVTILVCPGGAYHILAMDLEGSEICEWLNSIGVNAALLKYRVPRRAGLEKHAAPLQDAERAMALLRSNGKEWGMESKKIGVIGFSAGGHLAAALSNIGEEKHYPEQDAADKNEAKPDFTVLIYPAYLSVQEKNDELPPELQVTAKTPEAFITITQDDPVRVENAMAYAAALQKAKVPLELHIYPTGGHGYGLRPFEHAVSSWPARLEEWLKARVIGKQ
ncbi:MAG: alpha/beta hydrolase [Verrucomicrobiales bacterium]